MIKNATHSGFIVFPDLEEMKNIVHEHPVRVPQDLALEARIFPNPEGEGMIFLADLPTSDTGWGGSFRCFLYPDNKKLGTYEYVKEANLPSQKIDGFYSFVDDKFISTSHVLEQGGKKLYGMFIELEKINADS
jgi:hypothetical protein